MSFCLYKWTESGMDATETLEHHHQQETPNKYAQVDLCWTNCARGFICYGPGQCQWHQGKVRQEREALGIMGSYNMWHYSQQDFIVSGLGRGKASKKAATTKQLGFFISSLGRFFSLPVLATRHVCCSVCARLCNQTGLLLTCCKAEWKRKKTSAKYYNRFATVFHILYFPPLNLSFHFTSSCDFQMQNLSRGRRTQMCSTVSFFSISARSFLLLFSAMNFCLLWTGRWMEVMGWADFWVPPHLAYPSGLVEGDRMVEGLWRCTWWNTGRSCLRLVPSTAGSGRVGIWVLEVDSPMSGCMCRVLGVCFWHLFCCI